MYVNSWYTVWGDLPQTDTTRLMRTSPMWTILQNRFIVDTSSRRTHPHLTVCNLVPRVHWLFGQRVVANRYFSIGDHPLTKKQVDSGYEIEQYAFPQDGHFPKLEVSHLWTLLQDRLMWTLLQVGDVRCSL